MIIMYATSKNGDGFVQQVGEYEDIYDVTIRIGMFAPDVVITFEEKREEGHEKEIESIT